MALVLAGGVFGICALCGGIGLVSLLLSGESTSAPVIARLPAAINTIEPISAQGVIDRFNDAGLGATNVHQEERNPDSPLPNSYQDNLSFTVPEVAPKGGQVFVCDTKKNCDAIYAYFDALKGLAGPYLYQSPGGMVVVQMNSGLMPETGTKFEEAVKTLP